MATISGQVIFDRDRSATISSGDTGIFGVSVVLQNTQTSERLAVYTDMNGNYSFVNVPEGDYRIVESYGIVEAIASPGDFSLAVIGATPIGKDPTISIINNPPVGANDLDSLTPDTLFITVSGSDLFNQNFLDGPIRNIPIENILDSCVSVSEENLIDVADDGTFGFFPAGTPANTGVPIEPYPGVTPDYTYVLPNPDQYTPFGGEYTVQNIMNNALSQQIGAWWRIADHTTGNETGRMMVVNGFEPNSIFFTATISVAPNTNYLFSSWILNLFKVNGYANPELGVVILDEEGDAIYRATLGEEIPVNMIVPEWKEIGTVINSQDNTTLTVQFLSEAPEAIGNDYVIDDISLREINVPIFTPVKRGNTSVASVGDVVTYTVTLENTCSSPLTNVLFGDNVPSGLRFIENSVTVNGIQYMQANPNIGFNISDIAGGETAIITFDAIAEFVPDPNPTINSATITYFYSPVEGGIENEYTVDSNDYAIDIISSADVSVVKTVNMNPISVGETIIYTIIVTNNGPSDAENVILGDVISNYILNPEFSLNGGITWNSWDSEYTIGTLRNTEEITILIRGTIANSASGTIVNTATVSSTTPDPNPDNNTDTVIVTIQEEPEQADLSISKSAIPNPVLPGGVLTYTIDVTNLGPDVAENIVITDNIPSSVLNPESSLDGGVTWNFWNGEYNLDYLANGESITILIRGTVSNLATGTIMNSVTVSSTTPDPDLCNNNSKVITVVQSSSGLADLQITKKAISNVVKRRSQLIYVITITNHGPSTAEKIILLDNLPTSIKNPEFSLDGGITWNFWNDAYNVGSLTNGESTIILIRGKVSSRAKHKIINIAFVTSTTSDPNPDNNISISKVKIYSCFDNWCC